MDWATVIAAGITGVVGLGGIGGTLLSARLTSKSDAANLRTSISAEDARANRAEKRRIYAACVAALTAHADVIVGASDELQRLIRSNAVQVDDLNRTRLAAQNAVAEVDLIAPTEVAVLTHHAMQVVLHAWGASSAAAPGVAISALTMAMRRDLGAHVGSSDELVIAPAPEKPSKMA